MKIRSNLLTGIRLSQFMLWLAPLGFLLLFYFYPLGSILKVSFTRSETNFILPFFEAITSVKTWHILGFTFWQAILSTVVTIIIGLPAAYLMARYDFHGKSVLRALTGISFVLPTLVVATAFNALLGPRGWVNLALMDFFNLTQPPIQYLNTLTAIIVAHVFYNTTIVIRMVGDYWSRLDPRITQASQVLGANPFQTLLYVSIPVLLPAIITAAVLVFIFDFTSFGVILLLGGPQYSTLETEIYYQTVSLFNLPFAATLSVLQLVCTLVLTIAYTNLTTKISRPLSLKPQEFTQKKLGTLKNKFLVGFYLLFLLILFTTPLIALASRSFARLEPERGQYTTYKTGFTLDFYRELTLNRRQSLFYVPPLTAIAVSLSYASTTVILALFLGVLASWALVRDAKSRFNRVIDPILMLPLGTSAVTLGLGFIVALSHPPIDLRASIILIPLAHTLVALPFVVRSLTPSLRSIRPELRQAAQVLGASSGQVFRHIDLPMIGRALIVSAIFAFTISLGEFGATAMIARPEYPTIPVMIYRFISQPGALNYGQALALSTILMAATATAILAIERLRIADIGEF